MFQILTISLIAVFIEELVMRAKKFLGKDYFFLSFKPLDCAFCLAWWIGSIYFFGDLQGVLYAAMAAAITLFKR
jgi:hypothetical protein